MGVRIGDTSLIWWYALGYNFDFGVREYQKVENPWYKRLNKNVDLSFESMKSDSQNHLVFKRFISWIRVILRSSIGLF